MLRQATDADLNQVEEGYQKHFLHEKEHEAFTVFREGVYPTRADAAKAWQEGHCMSMMRMEKYWGASLPTGTSRMNTKQ